MNQQNSNSSQYPKLDPTQFNNLQVISVLRGNIHLISENLTQLAYSDGIEQDKLEYMKTLQGGLMFNRNESFKRQSIKAVQIMQTGLRYLMSIKQNLEDNINTMDAYSKHQTNYQQQLLKVRAKQKDKIRLLKEKRALHDKQVKLYEMKSRQLMDDPGLVLLPGKVKQFQDDMDDDGDGYGDDDRIDRNSRKKQNLNLKYQHMMRTQQYE